VHGIGAATAAEWIARGVTSLADAEERGLLSERQKVGARFAEDFKRRIPRAEVTLIAAAVREALRTVLLDEGVPAGEVSSAAEAVPCGSYRRGKESSGDVDVLITRRDGGRSCDLLPRVCAALSAAGHEMHHLHDPFEKKEKEEGESCSYMGIVRLEGYATHRRLDLKVYPREEFAYALLYFTGNDHFNRSMRFYAKKLGYSLSDHGLANRGGINSRGEEVRGTRNIVPAESEADIFAALGFEYRAPEDRHAEATIIQDGEAKRLPPLCDEADLSPDSQPLDSDSDSC